MPDKIVPLGGPGQWEKTVEALEALEQSCLLWSQGKQEEAIKATDSADLVTVNLLLLAMTIGEIPQPDSDAWNEYMESVRAHWPE